MIVVQDNTLTVNGDIRSIRDYNDIREHIQKILDGGVANIKIKIPTSKTLTSSVIGYLLKIRKRDNIKVTIEVGVDTLYEILEQLRLIEVFNVSKV